MHTRRQTMYILTKLTTEESARTNNVQKLTRDLATPEYGKISIHMFVVVCPMIQHSLKMIVAAVRVTAKVNLL